MKYPLRVISCTAWVLLTLSTCSAPKPNDWSITIPAIGASSSLVATDLNGDGHLDIVLGGAAQEFTALEASVIALDGIDGRLLWQVRGHNQVVGTAILQDLTGDGTDEVFIGGRSATFKAIDGRTGTVPWEYLPFDEQLDYVNDTLLLNFYTAQWIPDADGDGFTDILTAYGGFVKARRGETDRPGGYLMVLSGKTGKTLQKVAVPDGKETYLSPLVHDFGEGGEVIYGTGGESISGQLYRVALDSLLAGSLASSKLIVDGGNKGLIAPPVLVDITADGVADIIVPTVNGRLVAVDGRSSAQLWSAGPPGDVADFDRDGTSDVLVCVNEITRVGNAIHADDYRSNKLYTFAGGRGPAVELPPAEIGTNLGSTPLLCDLDADGYLDLITANMGDPLQFYSFRELKISRRELDVAAASIVFGGYMGGEQEGCDGAEVGPSRTYRISAVVAQIMDVLGSALIAVGSRL